MNLIVNLTIQLQSHRRWRYKASNQEIKYLWCQAKIDFLVIYHYNLISNVTGFNFFCCISS